MNDMLLLAITFIIYVMFVLFIRVIVMGVLAVVKLRNLTPFILKLMTERMCYVNENSRHNIYINFLAVFVKIVNAESALLKAYRVSIYKSILI